MCKAREGIAGFFILALSTNTNYYGSRVRVQKRKKI
jgi:hypothetical protein